MTASAPLPRSRADRAGESWTDAVPLLALSEAALWAVTVAAVFGMRRVFVGSEWLVPLLLQATVAHGLAAFLRRRGVSTGPSFLLLAATAGLVITWVYAGGTAFGVPTGTSLDALSNAIGDATGAFPDVKAPTDALDGFLVAVAAAVWLSAALGDWAAFRVGASLEAVLPSGTLFVLTAVLGADVDRLVATVVWLGAVLVFLLLRRADHLGRAATWVGPRRRAGPRSMLLAGLGLASVALLVAAVVGPRLPGAESPAVLSLTDLGDEGSGTRVVVNPLVDIRARMIQQADVEVFTVRSAVRSYWRLTSLNIFDGQTWKSSGSYGSADGDLAESVPVSSERAVVDQVFSISGLAQVWLPAAYEPRAIDVDAGIRYDEDLATIIIEEEGTTSDTLQYRVTSALPDHDVDALANASTEIPPDLAAEYLSLPADFPPDVRQVANEATAGATSPYERARMLQDFFRTGFTYDLGVEEGHGDGAIEEFVLETRRGYCEQFAGSYAAMARAVGLPARVAVGFTPGVTSPADPTLHRVRGEHAHAWPEVYLGEYGWVVFEPTPGRGAPRTEQYTGVPEQQVRSGGDPTTATTAVSPPSTAPDDAAGPTTTSRFPDEIESVDTETGFDLSTPATNPWFGRIGWAAVAFVAAVAMYLLAVLATTGIRRWRRRRHATAVVDHVALAWDDSLGAARDAGVAVQASETQKETASRIGAHLPAARDSIDALATTVEHTLYSSARPDDAVGTTALAQAEDVRRAARTSMTRMARLRGRFHPRRLRGG